MQCPKCNLENPATAVRCDCGWDFATASMQPPYLSYTGSGRPSYLSYSDVGDSTNYELASLSDRFIGQLLDSLIVIVAIILVLLASSFLPESIFGIALGGVVILGVLYLFLADGLAGGQSYGKRVMKTAVINPTLVKPAPMENPCFETYLCPFWGLLTGHSSSDQSGNGWAI